MSSRQLAVSCALLLLTGLAIPAAAARERRHSLSIHDDPPVADCSDLHIRFDDRDAVMNKDEHSLSRAEAPVLRVRDSENAGMQARGWEKDTYSVTACKAVDANAGDPQKLMSQVSVAIHNGEVSIHGPADRESWVVFLLIRTPKSAELDLHAQNGPIGLYGVDGKIYARATNGPISVKDCKGSADLAAENGPISFSGSGGSLRLHTENGPISVSLKGSSWQGSALVADAVNGPVTLRLPSGYASGVLVQSDGNSPMSCRASVCSEARKTWDDDHRRIEFGSGPAVIRLSTVNGPVSVKSAGEEL